MIDFQLFEKQFCFPMLRRHAFCPLANSAFEKRSIGIWRVAHGAIE
jgi:hypothetical protein